MFYNKHLYAYKQKFIRLKIKITIDQIVIEPKFICNTKVCFTTNKEESGLFVV